MLLLLQLNLQTPGIAPETVPIAYFPYNGMLPTPQRRRVVFKPVEEDEFVMLFL